MPYMLKKLEELDHYQFMHALEWYAKDQIKNGWTREAFMIRSTIGTRMSQYTKTNIH